MKISVNNIISGAGYLILGFLVAAGPQFLFPVCEKMGDGYMKCHWTAQAEIACGAVIALIGVLLFFFSSEAVRAGLQIALLFQLLSALLIPDVLIGVCKSDHMRCHSLTLPALNVISIVGILAGVVNLIYLIRKGKSVK